MDNEKLITSYDDAIECLEKNKPTSGYYMLQESINMAIKAMKNIQEYKKLENRLYDMFGGSLTLDQVINELENQIEEPDSQHPMNARILTYKESADWDAYRKIGTVKECRVAIEKQKPQKVVLVTRKNEFIKFYSCPCCSTPQKYIPVYLKQNYCVNCGQKLDWEENNDK